MRKALPSTKLQELLDRVSVGWRGYPTSTSEVIKTAECARTVGATADDVLNCALYAAFSAGYEAAIIRHRKGG